MSFHWPPDLPDFLLTTTLIILLPATCLILTPQHSPLHYITIAVMAFLASRFMHPYPAASGTRLTITAQLNFITVRAIHLLLIKRLDDRAMSRELPPHRTLFRSNRLWHAIQILIQPRGIVTPREIKNIPAPPAYYSTTNAKTKNASTPTPILISRAKFLTRQITIFTWQYLAADVVQAAARQQAFEPAAGSESGFTRINWYISPEKWVERGLTNLITWFVLTRILIDAHYRFLSILFVGLGFDTLENWPPAFGRMKDVYTVRKFWGKFWHQFLRGPFTGVSDFIARDILHLPRPSLVERYTNIFIVFFLSGVEHVLNDRVQTIPWEYSGAIISFPITIFAIMFEDGVQELWKRLNSPTEKGKEKEKAVSKTDDAVPPLWQRGVGYVWTLTWLGVASTWYLYPLYEVPPQLTTLVPVSLSERFGMKPLGSVVLGAGLLVGYLFGAEI